MEQHPDTIALEMITDAEAEPFLALSDVESHRRTAEYKGHKKQLEDCGDWGAELQTDENDISGCV